MLDLPPSAPPLAIGPTGYLALSGGHSMYWQQFGPADGIPAVVLHGGPGSALSPRLCALACQAGPYRVITFDQRGCGNSAPRGATRSNTLDHLVADIDALRIALGIPRWLVMGGSWGATLAAAYAARHTGAVSGVLLRGLFVPSHAELSWFFRRPPASTPPHGTPWQISRLPMRGMPCCPG